MKKFFCPAPWRSLFYHVDKSSVCCISSKQFDMTPVEFLNSDYLKNLRQKFLDDEFDDTCTGCKRLEDAGLQSIRQHMVRLYGGKVTVENATPELDYMELRASNLCNFQCKMCNAQNSSLIAGEVYTITDDNFNEILKISTNLKHLVLTGGEPMLIKHYYVLLDHLALSGKPDLNLRIYTNASVYNPVFVEKILKFNTKLTLSIDGVGATAENQRTGTDWKTVSENIDKFLKLPINIIFHTTLTTISLQDVDSLVEYFVGISLMNPNCTFKVHTANKPDNLSIFKIHKTDIQKSIESIDRALELSKGMPVFGQLRTELMSCKKTISNRI